METVRTIIENGQFTELEIQVINYLNEMLKSNFGEYWSGEDAQNIAHDINQPVNVVKGVLSSLNKKHVVDTDEYGAIFFCRQGEMEYESITDKVKQSA